MKVLCNVKECLHCKQLEKPRKLKYGQFSESMSEYLGECDKEEIGIQMRVIETLSQRYEVPECYSQAVKKMKYHVNFSRFPEGGHISDPVDPGTAYH